MKNIYLLFSFIMLNTFSFAQLDNVSFEENGNPSLDHWEAVCINATSENDPAPDSGDWSIKILSGNTQGCIWPQYYQELQGLNSGDNLSLNGWIKSSGNIDIGIGIGIWNSNGLDTIFAMDTTILNNWKNISLETEVVFSSGDQIVVFLFPGLTAGPVGGDNYFGMFDGLEIAVNTNQVLEKDEEYFLNIYPNPVTGNYLQLESSIPQSEFISLAVYDCIGREVYLCQNYHIALAVNQFPKGIYFLKIVTRNGELVRTFIVDHP